MVHAKMKRPGLSRRTLLKAVVPAMALAFGSPAAALAETDYPTRDITLVLPALLVHGPSEFARHRIPEILRGDAERIRRLVGDATDLGGVLAAHHAIELGARELGWFVKLLSHPLQPRRGAFDSASAANHARFNAAGLLLSW